MPLSVFFVFAENDRTHYEELSKQIKPFIRKVEGDIFNMDSYPDEEKLCSSSAIIVLVSADYLSGEELDVLRESVTDYLINENKKVIPIVVKKCDWKEEIAFLGRKVYEFDLKNDDWYFNAAIKIKEELLQIKPKISLEKKLQESLLSINYHDQRNHLNNYFQPFELVNIMLMKGSEQGGFQLLINIFNYIKKIAFNDPRKQIVINARYFSNFQEENYIWETLADKLDIHPWRNADINIVVNNIMERLNTEPIVIRFDDIHLVKKESLEVVRKMWEKIYLQIKSRLVIPKHQIFIFVTDRSGNNEAYLPEEFSETVEQNLCNKIVCLLPIIKNLDKNELDIWYRILDTNPDLKVLCDLIKDKDFFTTKSELPVTEAISQMIDILGMTDDSLRQKKSIIYNSLL